MPGYRPTNPRTHEKVGPCALCGRRGRRTETHVPPRAAFNNGDASRGIQLETDEGSTTTLSRPRAGGNRIYGLCSPCHRLTSPFDDEYIAWAGACAKAAHIRAHSDYAGDGTVVLEGARPGRFVRAALAGMASTAENLWQDHPALVESVRTGEPINPPADLRFIVGFTQIRDWYFVEGVHRGALLTIPIAGGPLLGIKTLPTPSATIHWFPFSLMLVHPDTGARYPHVDHTDWIAEGAEGPARDVELRLPTVSADSVVTVPLANRRPPD